MKENVKAPTKIPKYSGKGTRARLNTMAGKSFFGNKGRKNNQ